MMRPLVLSTLVCACLTVALSCTYDPIDSRALDDAGNDASLDGSTDADSVSPDPRDGMVEGGGNQNGDGDGDGDAGDGGDHDLDTGVDADTGLELEPAWPDTPEWGDHLSGQPGNPGDNCPPDELHPDFCFRAGALRKLVLEHETSCDDLEASDEEHWYDWKCEVKRGEVAFTSTLRPEVGLTELIDATKRKWRPNSVTVTRSGEAIATTEPTAFWDTPIFSLPAASGGVIELDHAGAVYVITGRAEGVVHIAAHGISLLGVRNATLSALASSSAVLFTEERRAFVWIENLSIDADEQPAGVDLSLMYGVVRGLEVERGVSVAATTTPDLKIDAYASQLQGLVSIDAPGIGVELGGEGYVDTVQGVVAVDSLGDGVRITRTRGLITDVSVSGCGGDGVQLPNSVTVTLDHVSVADCDGDGIDTANGKLVVLSDVVVSNNGGSGVVLRGDDQLLTTVFSANNERDGVRLEGDNALLMHATTTNNTGAGLHVASGASANEIVNVVSANNATGLWLDGGSAGSLVHNAWLSANATDDVLVEGNGNVFTGTLDLGGTDACTIVGSAAQPGLSASPCAIANTSTATISFDNPLYTSDGALAGHQLLPDPQNAAVLDNGILAYDAITDWLGFSVRPRHWGRPPSGGAFPNDAARGRCDAESSCAIWDWSVTSHPSRIRDPMGAEGEALDDELPSATHVRKHVWAASNDEGCLASAHTVFVENPEPECSTMFVDYAIEPIHYSYENSICAAGGSCFLNRNRGAFPGAGFGEDQEHLPWQYPPDVVHMYSVFVDRDDGGSPPEEEWSVTLPGFGEIYLYYFVHNGD